jgi:hypothetical protein
MILNPLQQALLLEYVIKQAAFNDEPANEELRSNGSYSFFDSAHTVEAARKVLTPMITRAGDTVRHMLIGESWLVAKVTNTGLYACGWPCTFCEFEAGRVILVEQCTNEEHAAMIARWSEPQHKGDPRYQGA